MCYIFRSAYAYNKIPFYFPFLVISCISFGLRAHGLPQYNLHKYMSPADLEYHFGVDTVREVPDYDLVSPVYPAAYQAFPRLVKKRSFIHPAELQFEVRIFDQNYTITAVRNDRLVAANFLVDFFGRSFRHRKTFHPPRQATSCHYQAAVSAVGIPENGRAVFSSDPSSGLYGIVEGAEKLYRIKPVKPEVIERYTAAFDVAEWSDDLHIVYPIQKAHHGYSRRRMTRDVGTDTPYQYGEPLETYQFQNGPNGHGPPHHHGPGHPPPPHHRGPMPPPPPHHRGHIPSPPPHHGGHHPPPPHHRGPMQPPPHHRPLAYYHAGPPKPHPGSSPPRPAGPPPLPSVGPASPPHLRPPGPNFRGFPGSQSHHRGPSPGHALNPPGKPGHAGQQLQPQHHPYNPAHKPSHPGQRLQHHPHNPPPKPGHPVQGPQPQHHPLNPTQKPGHPGQGLHQPHHPQNHPPSPGHPGQGPQSHHPQHPPKPGHSGQGPHQLHHPQNHPPKPGHPGQGPQPHHPQHPPLKSDHPGQGLKQHPGDLRGHGPGHGAGQKTNDHGHPNVHHKPHGGQNGGDDDEDDEDEVTVKSTTVRPTTTLKTTISTHKPTVATQKPTTPTTKTTTTTVKLIEPPRRLYPHAIHASMNLAAIVDYGFFQVLSKLALSKEKQIFHILAFYNEVQTFYYEPHLAQHASLTFSIKSIGFVTDPNNDLGEEAYASQYLNNLCAGPYNLPEYDHLQALTMLDMYETMDKRAKRQVMSSSTQFDLPAPRRRSDIANWKPAKTDPHSIPEEKKVFAAVGLALLGSTCSKSHHCSVVEMNSFTPSISAAHELGHSLGMNHEGANGCATIDSLTSFVVPTQPMKSGWTEFGHLPVISKCAVKEMVDFLKGEGSCLVKGAPADVDKMFKEKLQDALKHPFTAEEVCKLKAGPLLRQLQKWDMRAEIGAEQSNDPSVCRSLHCYGKKTSSSPDKLTGWIFGPAPVGTQCDKQGTKFCFNFQCVDKAALPKDVAYL